MVDIWVTCSHTSGYFGVTHHLAFFFCYTQVWMFCSLFRDGSSALSITFLFDFVVHCWMFFSFFSFFCLRAAWVAIVLFTSLHMLVLFHRFLFFVFVFFFFSFVLHAKFSNWLFSSVTLYKYQYWSASTLCVCITWLWIWAFGAHKLVFEEECLDFTCAHACLCVFLFFFLHINKCVLFCSWSHVLTAFVNFFNKSQTEEAPERAKRLSPISRLCLIFYKFFSSSEPSRCPRQASREISEDFDIY